MLEWRCAPLASEVYTSLDSVSLSCTQSDAMSNLIPDSHCRPAALAGLKFGSFGVKVRTSMSSSPSEKIFQIKNFGLPLIRTVDDLAEHTRISPQLVRYLSYRANFLYKRHEVPKKDGTMRLIAQPSRELKAMQAWILRNILNKLSSSENCKGFELGCSILDNAAPHVSANFILNVDLKDFFPSIVASKVYGIFSTIGYSRKIAALLTNLTTFEGRLPQGAPTSPKLANLICLKLDARIQGYSGPRGLVYTRYADDISISAQTIKKLMNARSVLGKIISSEGLTINHRKTSLQGTMRRKEITGLVLTENRVGIGRASARKIRAKIFHLFAERSVDFSHVNGMLAYVHSVDKTIYKKLWHYIDQLNSRFPSSPAVQQLRRPRSLIVVAVPV
jgi:RNA-directed DNA polymerase